MSSRMATLMMTTTSREDDGDDNDDDAEEEWRWRRIAMHPESHDPRLT